MLPLVNQALENERTDVEIPWRNVETGSSGTIVVERTFYRDPNTPCRDYRRTIERSGAPTVVIEGTGCRVQPGRWSLDEQEPATAAATAAETPTTPTPTETTPTRAEAPPSCPPVSAVRVPCGKPPAFVDYSLPTRTEL